MTRKERIVKAMKRDAEIHTRGHFTANERNTNTILMITPAREFLIQIEEFEDDYVANCMKDLVEAK